MPLSYNIFGKRPKDKKIKESECIIYKLSEKEIEDKYGYIKPKSISKSPSTSYNYNKAINDKYKLTKHNTGTKRIEYWNVPVYKRYM